MGPGDWASIGAMLVVVALFVIAFFAPKKPHKHTAQFWDGFYEHCRCGASSGDKRNPDTGMRYAFFSDWPEEE